MTRRQQRKRTQQIVHYSVLVSKEYEAALKALIELGRDRVRSSAWAQRVFEHRKTGGFA
jgi:hypothetical protein